MNPLLRVALPTLLLASAAQAATVLIDNSTLNGSFEDGTGTTAVTSWTAAPGQSLQRQNNNAEQGGWSLVVGSNLGNTVLSGAAIATGYSIATGDDFTLSFSLRGAFGADPSDRVAWSLFFTDDDTLGGAQTVLLSGSNALVGATGTLATSPYSSTGPLVSGPAGNDAVGRVLFLSITPGAGMTNDEFARVDSVNLTVGTVPEPGVAGLAALALAGAGMVRRRR